MPTRARFATNVCRSTWPGVPSRASSGGDPFDYVPETGSTAPTGGRGGDQNRTERST